mgnify:CR=1 FL=1
MYNNKNSYKYSNLFEDFIIEFRNDEKVCSQKLNKTEFIKILSCLDRLVFEEAIYHGTTIQYPKFCNIHVLLENDSTKAHILDTEQTNLKNKKVIKVINRINSAATKLNKSNLEKKGDFTTDPTVYYTNTFFAKIRFSKHKNKLDIKSKLITVYRAKPSNKYRKILASYLSSINKEEASIKYNDMLQNSNIIQKDLIRKINEHI